jgi:hypothetical protein
MLPSFLNTLVVNVTTSLIVGLPPFSLFYMFDNFTPIIFVHEETLASFVRICIFDGWIRRIGKNVVYFRQLILGLSETAARPTIGMAAFIFPGIEPPEEKEKEQIWK